MPFPRTEDKIVEEIKLAPAHETVKQLAQRLEVAEGTVKKYRKEGRDERGAIAKEILQEYVTSATPTALGVMEGVLKISYEEYNATRESDDGRLALTAACKILDYMGLVPETDPLEGTASVDLLEELEHRLGLRRV